MEGSPVKVLLVDDDEDDYLITRDLISQIRAPRHQLEWVNNYEDGLAAVGGAQHHLCLLDYRLGERTGLELLRESREFQSCPPIILLTGQGDPEIDVEAMKAGFPPTPLSAPSATPSSESARRKLFAGNTISSGTLWKPALPESLSPIAPEKSHLPTGVPEKS